MLIITKLYNKIWNACNIARNNWDVRL